MIEKWMKSFIMSAMYMMIMSVIMWWVVDMGPALSRDGLARALHDWASRRGARVRAACARAGGWRAGEKK